MIVLLVLLMGCAAPKIATYDQAQMARKPGNVLFVDFKSGERFSFAEPGGSVIQCKNVLFGRTATYEFVTLYASQLDSVYTDRPVTLSELDSTSLITRVTTKTYMPYSFDARGARYYKDGQFINGTTLNGTRVTLPLDQIEAGQKLLNYENVRAGRDFKTFLGVIGVLGLVVLRVMAEAGQ